MRVEMISKRIPPRRDPAGRGRSPGSGRIGTSIVALIVALVSSASAARGQIVDVPGMLDLVDKERFYIGAFPPPVGRFFEIGAARYFAHDDGVHGSELWKTDGTPEGTVLFHDVCPGICSGVVSSEMAASGGLLFFRGYDGIHGEELFVSDGETVSIVADIQPGSIPSRPSRLTATSGAIYFLAYENPDSLVYDPTAWRLWRSDGTEFGTHPVVEVPAETEPYGDLGGELVFGKDQELWITTGGGSGVQKLSPDGVEVEHFGVPWDPGSAFALGRYFFQGRNATHGSEPWVTDGTPGGTGLLSDLTPGSGDSTVHEVRELGGIAVLRATTPATGSELWVSDGTPEGTEPLGEIVDGSGSGAGFLLGPLDGGILFYGYDAVHGYEPWLTDGTSGGTAFLVDLRPGDIGSLSPYVELLYGGDGDRFLFFARTPDGGSEPWITDGTAGGSELLVDLISDPWAEPPWWGRPSWKDGEALFFAWAVPGSGWEPWRTDGTSSGTGLLGDLHDQSSSAAPCGTAVCPAFAPTPAGTFFSVSDEGYFSGELHVSDGTLAGTRPLPVVHEGLEHLVLLTHQQGWAWTAHGVLFEDGWFVVSDGTPAGTGELTDGAGDLVGPDSAWNLPTIRGSAFYPDDSELWKTDGSPGGTVNIPGVATGGWVSDAITHADELFAAAPGTIWRVDAGGAASAFVTLPEPTNRPSLLGALTETGPFRLVFYFDDGVHGWEPWVTDGTPEGTVLLGDLMPGPEGSVTQYWFDEYADRGEDLREASNGRLVAFLATDPTGDTLFVTDGTPGGILPVVDPVAGVSPEEPRWIVRFGDGFAFQAWSAPHGQELWIHDGSGQEATVLDLLPGSGSSTPRNFAQIDAHLAFSAFDPEHGVELWTSDGTAAGTALAHDLNPGPGSSSPQGLSAGYGRLWFSANDGVHGFEPWSAKLTSIFADGFESGSSLNWSEAGE